MITSAVYVNLLWKFLLPVGLEYAQGPAIRYFKQLKDKEVEIAVFGYKSYAQMFYTQRKTYNPASIYDLKQLAKSTDKKIFVITKIHRVEELTREIPAEIVDKTGGFVLLRLKKVKC
jgi:hypothetical protein